jgi:hypothetical protein
MLAAGHPQRLFVIERDDFPAPLFCTPGHERSLRPSKVGHVNVWRNCPTNNELFRIAVNHMEVTVAVFDFDRLCDQDFSVKQTPHCPPLHSIPCLPERVWSGTRFLNAGNTGLYTSVYINGGNARAVVFLRPTEEPFRRVSPETRQPSVGFATQGALANTPAPRAGDGSPASPAQPFDNDNEPWREAA